MSDFWYDDAKCPLCSEEFKVAKVKTQSIKIDSYDKDLKPNYKGPNVGYFSTISCPKCKFTFLEKDKETIKGSVNPERFGKINTYLKNLTETDLEKIDNSENKSQIFFKQQLIVAAEIYSVLDKPFEVGRILLRLAWYYRDTQETGKELKVLNDVFTICEKYYEKAYTDNDAIFSLFYKAYIHFRFNRVLEAKSTFEKLVSKYRDARSPYIKAAKELRGDIQ